MRGFKLYMKQQKILLIADYITLYLETLKFAIKILKIHKVTAIELKQSKQT